MPDGAFDGIACNMALHDIPDLAACARATARVLRPGGWFAFAVTHPCLEVLRGPSAMLYGQGSTAGIVNMVSKRPLDTFQGEVGVQYGNYDRKQIQADLTGPLTADGKWLYRIVALKRDANTQVDHVPDNRLVIAPTLTWQPSAATRLTLQGLYQDDESGSTA